MAEIKVIQSDLSRTQAIQQLATNDQILEGRNRTQEFDKHDLDYLYSILGKGKKYIRDSSVGHTSNSYANWVVSKAEDSYSIWRYPLAGYKHNDNNQLFFDEEIFTYKGRANSVSIDTFSKVLVKLYGNDTDQTAEAGSEDGTGFTFLQDIDGSTTYLYACGASEFSGVDFDLETVGSNYELGFEYWGGSDWIEWDGACSASAWDDNTNNLTGNGRVEFELPAGWTQSAIDGTTGYWGRFRTGTKPAIVASAYHILPGDSVPALLSLSEGQILNEEWAWCYFNNYIYVTIRNNGDSYYEGDFYIKQSSSGIKKKNYFVYNHEFTVNYERDSVWIGGWEIIGDGASDVLALTQNGTGKGLRVKQNSTENGIFIDQNGNGIALNIDSEATSADVINIDSAITNGTLFDINLSAITTGKGIDIAASTLTNGNLIRLANNSTTFVNGNELYISHIVAVDGLSNRVGNLIKLYSHREERRTSGTTSDNYQAIDITRYDTIDGAGGIFNAAGSMLRLTNTASQVAGTLNANVQAIVISHNSFHSDDIYAIGLQSNNAGAGAPGGIDMGTFSAGEPLLKLPVDTAGKGSDYGWMAVYVTGIGLKYIKLYDAS